MNGKPLVVFGYDQLQALLEGELRAQLVKNRSPRQAPVIIVPVNDSRCSLAATKRPER
jgi:hypothetical protein